MEFMRSRPDVIRSINQRWLFAYWHGLRGTTQVPIWQGLEIADITTMSENIAFLDVVDDRGEIRFKSRWRGERIDEAFGRPGREKFLDEILPASYRDAALTTYHHVLATLQPVYTIADLRDRNGRIVHYERLLLPISRTGGSVDQILASLETVSPEGGFDNRGLFVLAARPPAFALCATIQD